MKLHNVGILLTQAKFLESLKFYQMDGRIYCDGLFQFFPYDKEPHEKLLARLNDAIAPAISELLGGVLGELQTAVMELPK